MLLAVVEPNADPGLGEARAQRFRDRHHGGSLLIGALDRDDHHLDRCNGGGQAQPGVVAVRHHHRADHAGRKAPGRAPGVLLLAAGVQELHVIRASEVLAEEVAGAALERLAHRA